MVGKLELLTMGDEMSEDAIAFEIDVPNVDDISGNWITLESCKTKAEAVEWIRQNIGHCDDEGRIRLISEIYS